MPSNNSWHLTSPCFGNESSFVDRFRVDIGPLKILGVAPLDQHRTCVAGLSCHIEGIIGEELTDADGVLVMETCGRAAVVSGFPGFGLLQDVSRTMVRIDSYINKLYHNHTQ